MVQLLAKAVHFSFGRIIVVQEDGVLALRLLQVLLQPFVFRRRLFKDFGNHLPLLVLLTQVSLEPTEMVLVPIKTGPNGLLHAKVG